MRNVIFHVPHDGTARPEELMASVCVPQEVFSYYEGKMRDVDARRLVPAGYRSVCFALSRLLCDVERFVDGSEPMERYGMGFCYEKVYDGTVIKRLTPEVLACAMKYYSRHHDVLDRAAKEGNLLLIDLHSFSDEIVVGPAAGRAHADICLGYDPAYCAPEALRQAQALCRAAGYSVCVNTPYCGSFVPGVVLREGLPGVRSLMVEVNRRVYRPGDVSDERAIRALRKLLGQIADALGR